MKIIERWNIEISSSLRNIYLGKVSFFTSIFDLFSVYIYTHAPKFKLTCWKTSINSDTPFFQKKILQYSSKQIKYQKINWSWRLGTICVKDICSWLDKYVINTEQTSTNVFTCIKFNFKSSGNTNPSPHFILMDFI